MYKSFDLYLYYNIKYRHSLPYYKQRPNVNLAFKIVSFVFLILQGDKLY